MVALVDNSTFTSHQKISSRPSQQSSSLCSDWLRNGDEFSLINENRGEAGWVTPGRGFLTSERQKQSGFDSWNFCSCPAICCHSFMTNPTYTSKAKKPQRSGVSRWTYWALSFLFPEPPVQHEVGTVSVWNKVSVTCAQKHSKWFRKFNSDSGVQ